MAGAGVGGGERERGEFSQSSALLGHLIPVSRRGELRGFGAISVNSPIQGGRFRDVLKQTPPQNLTVPLNGVTPIHGGGDKSPMGTEMRLGVEGDAQHPRGGGDRACAWKIKPRWRRWLKDERPVA